MSIITHLNISNIMRISAVEIEASGGTIKITGQNGNGKSSVLDSIAMLIGGQKMFPLKPVRVGEKQGVIDGEITAKDGSVLILKRTIESDGDGKDTTTKLEVSEKRNGRVAKMKGAQALLDSIRGDLMFDPLEFTRKTGKAQVMAVKEVIGLNTDELDAREKSLFDKRTEVNRDLKHAESQWAAAQRYDDAPKEPVSMGDLVAQLHAANEANSRLDTITSEYRDWSLRVGTLNEKVASKSLDISRLERQLAEARDELSDLSKRRDAAAAEGDKAAERVEAFRVVDTAPIRDRMSQVETINQHVRANAEEARLRKERDAAKSESDRFTDEINAVREQRTTLMAAAQWPVDGMGFDDDGVTLNGLPFKQASSAEQLRTSLKISMAANPELKVAFIRDGSLLDDNSMRLVAEEIAAVGGQLWIERVSDDDPGAIVIENGAIRGVVEPELAMV